MIYLTQSFFFCIGEISISTGELLSESTKHPMAPSLKHVVLIRNCEIEFYKKIKLKFSLTELVDTAEKEDFRAFDVCEKLSD